MAHHRITAGEYVSVSAAVLGALAVLAELCFRFPDVLVYREALPFYAAHIGAFRVALLVAIVLTFVLGCAGVFLGDARRYAAMGLILGTVAILMGGPRAEAAMDQPLPMSAGLDYFILSLLVLALLFVPMERLWPLRPQAVFRPGWQTDLTHFFANHVAVQLLAFFTIVPVQLLFAWAVDGELQRRVASQPVWLQFIEILFAVDLVSYWVHRAFHQVPVLWRFHSIHHSIEQMDWLAGSRLHLIDTIATRLFGLVPIFLLGFAPAAVYGYLVFVSFHAVYIHANVSHRWPRMSRLITTPDFHHWHHAAEPQAVDKNFAVILSALDWMFGTAYQPGRWPERYGILGEQAPDGYARQLVHPFMRRK